MNYLLLFFFFMGWAFAARAQDAEGNAQLARIASERAQAEATFRAQEKACYGKFAVSDCIGAAKARRREVLADLRRQEVAINDAQRKRNAERHLREIEERSAPARQQEQAEQRSKSTAEQQARQASAEQKAAERASSEASATAKAAERRAEVARKEAEAESARSRKADEAARNAKAQQERLAESQEKKAAMDKRVAERGKGAAKPLPPPTSPPPN